MICPHLQIRIEITTTFFMVIHCCVLVDVSKLYSFFSSFTCLLIVSIIRSVIRMGFLLIPITLHTELLCMMTMLYTKCPSPISVGRRYSAGKVLMLSILFVVPPLTAYTYAPSRYEGTTIFLRVIICHGDITGCTHPFLLTELIIFTVEAFSPQSRGYSFYLLWEQQPGASNFLLHKSNSSLNERHMRVCITII